MRLRPGVVVPVRHPEHEVDVVAVERAVHPNAGDSGFVSVTLR